MGQSIEVVAREGDARTVTTVVDKLQEKFQELKRRNPWGYRDEWDSRYAIICLDVAQELGGVVTEYLEGDDEIQFFDFTGLQIQRRPGGAPTLGSSQGCHVGRADP